MKMQSINPLLSAAHQADDSTLIVGKHGIGKTEIAIDWAKEHQINMEVLYLSNQEVGDLIGIPETTDLNGKRVTMWTEPIWLQRLHEAAFPSNFELSDLTFNDKEFEKFVLENMNKE